MSGQGICVRLAGRLGAFELDVDIAAPMQGITAIFGPSGCGKTTILRCVAGLQHIPGRIEIADACWQDTSSGQLLPPHKRDIGYVFQEASLFAHLSVKDNLLYGARRAQKSAGNASSLDEIVELLGIPHLLDRSPARLSGGERQRVAVGRALLSRPRILLMDEPLSALDQETKNDILPHFEKLKDTLGIPAIYVSHDLAEIERLADKLILMDNGRVVASGLLRELQTDPSLPLIGSTDASVALECRIADYDPEYDLTRLEFSGGHLTAPGRAGEPGALRRMRITASDVSIARTANTESTIANSLPARIVAIEPHPQGAQVNVILALGADGDGHAILARCTRKSRDALNLQVGDSVIAQIKSVALVSPGR